MTIGPTVYVTYDGALDPLGSTQVVAYLTRLARLGLRQTLVSFEKAERWADVGARAAMTRRLHEAGIAWQPLRYHRTPRLPATAWDLLRGALVLRRVVRASGARLVHCRGDVAMALARAARVAPAARLVYEARGLFSDERVEVGSWRRGSLLDRSVRWIERGNLAAAAGLLCVMAPPGLAALAARHQPLPPYELLPNSVDLDAFTPRASGEPAEFGIVYHGSLGGWYLTSEIVAFMRQARELVPGRALWLTPQLEEARRAGVNADWAELRSVPPSEVPAWLRRAQAACFFIQPSPAKRASSPTKFAEALACGLPVVANGASGELDVLLARERVGVCIDDFAPASLRAGAQRLAGLLADPATAGRCRALAEGRYSLTAAAQAYHDLYRILSDAP